MKAVEFAVSRKGCWRNIAIALIDGRARAQRNKTFHRTVCLIARGLMLLSSLFDGTHSGLVEVLARFFPLFLWWTVGRPLVQ